MSNVIRLTETNSVYAENTLSFWVGDEHAEFYVLDKTLALTHEQFEEAVKFYAQKKVERAKSRMKSNNTVVVDYSNPISGIQLC
jgi:hypothetical protein